jgi:hypothetical protein
MSIFVTCVLFDTFKVAALFYAEERISEYEKQPNLCPYVLVYIWNQPSLQKAAVPSQTTFD